MRKRAMAAIAVSTVVAGSGVVIATAPWESDDELPSGPCSRRWPPVPAADDAATAAPAGTAAAAVADRGDRSSSSGPQQRPNVLVLMADDMRADELGGPWMDDTRRLIADQGVSFRNSSAPLPLCGPARASFLTGRYAHNTGVQDNDQPPAFQRLEDDNTLPIWLERAGYNTALLGKYLNGYGGGTEPEDENGLSEWRSLAEPFGDTFTEYVPPGWDHWYASYEPTTYRYRDTQLSDDGNGTIDLTGRYQTSAYGDLGSRLVSRLARDQRPFFLDVSFTAPHGGWPREEDDSTLASPARLGSQRGAYDDRITTPRGVVGEPCNERKPSTISDDPPLTSRDQAAIVDVVRQRAEALATLDDSVARILGALQRWGELDETYVIFTSDNGYFLGEFRQNGGKGSRTSRRSGHPR